MKSVDTGKEKVKKICEVLRKETIDPAKKERDEILAKARQAADKLIADAKKDAARLIEEAREKIQEERSVFKSSMNLACKKSLDTLRGEIEKSLFNPALSEFFSDKMKDPSVIAKLISSILHAIEKEGIGAELHALIPKEVKVEAVNQELVKSLLEKLRSKSVELGEIQGGAQVKIADQNLTIDLSDKALKSLVSRFVRDDFRAIIFNL